MIQYQRLLRYGFFVIYFLCLAQVSQARCLPGYIITNNNDTIHGKINIYSFNRNTGHYNFSGIDLEFCFLEVAFKKTNKEKYTIYKPDEIKGYGFMNKKINYTFRSFLIAKKSIIASEREQIHFLQLVDNKDGILIFKKLQYVVKDFNNIKNPEYVKKRLVPEYDYYAYSEELGLLKTRIIKRKK